MNNNKINQIFKIFATQNPHPTTELIFSSPFELLIAVLLSAQSTDKQVNIATAKLFKTHNTPATILNLDQDKLEKYISSIGLYHTKAKHILATCKILTNEFNGTIPQTRTELEKLPGVGRKTANVILNTAFGQPTMAVDTHIFRTSQRIGLVKPAKTPTQVEHALLKVIPEKYLLNAHHWLILHGRYVCIARKPKCPICKIKHLCEFKDKAL